MYSEISSLLLITEIQSLTARVPEARPRNSVIEGGFPHSEIRGSKLVRSSPRLIAAYHVLHRLSAPRHPPNALLALDHSHDRCPPPHDGRSIRKTIVCLQNTSHQPRGHSVAARHALVPDSPTCSSLHY